MKYPSFEEWVGLGDRYEDYQKEVEYAFKEFMENEVEGYLQYTKKEIPSTEEFCEEFCGEFEFPDYDDWLYSEYEASIGEYEDAKYDEWRDSQL
jgi:hypothetical protein